MKCFIQGEIKLLMLSIIQQKLTVNINMLMHQQVTIAKKGKQCVVQKSCFRTSAAHINSMLLLELLYFEHELVGS